MLENFKPKPEFVMMEGKQKKVHTAYLKRLRFVKRQ